tara:strand:+ start:1415 stop:1663 length:249 start_codon:yes stop_codon:yes gene_type:complete
MIRQVYSDPEMPSVEVFYYTDDSAFFYHYHGENPGEYKEAALKPGYYFWYCFPGCLPDSEPWECTGIPWGPYETEQEAIADA